VARLKSTEIEIIQQGKLKTAGKAISKYAYLDTIKQSGIITELIETKLMRIPVPQREFMMRIGCITGDVENMKV